jgi:hypothetical protein
MALDDHLEDGLVPLVHEALHELPVREKPRDSHAEEGLEVTDPVHQAVLFHVSHSVGLVRALSAYYPVEPIFIHHFARRP